MVLGECYFIYVLFIMSTVSGEYYFIDVLFIMSTASGEYYFIDILFNECSSQFCEMRNINNTVAWKMT